MDYIKPVNPLFVAKAGTVKMKKTLSPQLRARMDFINSHNFIVTVDSSTKEASMRVEKKAY